ncbi:MAG: bacterial Ig-like domain-containing protein [Lactobacillales bacterium]|jgi:uncharacterized protein YjdB|nr:bacterial Ig-like domain-containing protein [Lactobacillales bacterium]
MKKYTKTLFAAAATGLLLANAIIAALPLTAIAEEAAVESPAQTDSTIANVDPAVWSDYDPADSDDYDFQLADMSAEKAFNGQDAGSISMWVYDYFTDPDDFPTVDDTGSQIKPKNDTSTVGDWSVAGGVFNVRGLPIHKLSKDTANDSYSKAFFENHPNIDTVNTWNQFSEKELAQSSDNVVINKENFPDRNFRKFLSTKLFNEDEWGSANLNVVQNLAVKLTSNYQPSNDVIENELWSQQTASITTKYAPANDYKVKVIPKKLLEKMKATETEKYVTPDSAIHINPKEGYDEIVDTVTPEGTPARTFKVFTYDTTKDPGESKTRKQISQLYINASAVKGRFPIALAQVTQAEKNELDEQYEPAPAKAFNIYIANMVNWRENTGNDSTVVAKNGNSENYLNYIHDLTGIGYLHKCINKITVSFTNLIHADISDFHFSDMIFTDDNLSKISVEKTGQLQDGELNISKYTEEDANRFTANANYKFSRNNLKEIDLDAFETYRSTVGTENHDGTFTQPRGYGMFIEVDGNLIESLDKIHFPNDGKSEDNPKLLADISNQMDPVGLKVNLANNNLKSIDGIKSSSVFLLDISGNKITELDALKGLSQLNELSAGRNGITHIDGTQLPENLFKLELGMNQFESLDISTLAKLNSVGLYGCPLTSIKYNTNIGNSKNNGMGVDPENPFINDSVHNDDLHYTENQDPTKFGNYSISLDDLGIPKELRAGVEPAEDWVLDQTEGTFTYVGSKDENDTISTVNKLKYDIKQFSISGTGKTYFEVHFNEKEDIPTLAVKDIVINQGDKFDPKAAVVSATSEGEDASAAVTGMNFNTNEVGKHKVTYYLKNKFKKTVKAVGYVTVVPKITYQGHVQSKGWMDDVQAGQISGTSGQSLRLEAFRIHEIDGNLADFINVQTHVQSIGWETTDARKLDGLGQGGTAGQGLRVEALRLTLTEKYANDFDIYYCTHVQSIGWQDWVKNGADAGTTGKGLRLEAYAIKIVPKGAPAPAKLK